MGAGIAAGPHCRRCWHSGFPAPELTASFRRSLPFGSRPFERPVLSNDAPPVRFAGRSRLQAGASLSAPPSVLRRPQFLTTWAWQSLVPVPHSARCRASCCCERVSLRFLRAPLPPVRPCGLTFGRCFPREGKGPSARPGVLPLAPLPPALAPGLATIGLAASTLLRDAIPASGADLSGLHFALSDARLSTPKLVSSQTFRSSPIGKILPFNQCLAALFSGFVSLSTRQMLRLSDESHKQQNTKLSTGSPMAGGQLRKLRKPLCFRFATIRTDPHPLTLSLSKGAGAAVAPDASTSSA
jgi:hypothetical protein